MNYGVHFRVWGERALFTRPELKAERVSYDVPPASALRGVAEAIHWKPAIRYKIRRVAVLNPIRFASVRRNELGTFAPCDIEDHRQQRASLPLRDAGLVFRGIGNWPKNMRHGKLPPMQENNAGTIPARTLRPPPGRASAVNGAARPLPSAAAAGAATNKSDEQADPRTGFNGLSASQWAALAGGLLSRFARPGDTALDPFCGSGTTIVEARLRGMRAVGVDINGLACLISKVKATPLTAADLAEVRRALDEEKSVRPVIIPPC